MRVEPNGATARFRLSGRCDATPCRGEGSAIPERERRVRRPSLAAGSEPFYPPTNGPGSLPAVVVIVVILVVVPEAAEHVVEDAPEGRQRPDHLLPLADRLQERLLAVVGRERRGEAGGPVEQRGHLPHRAGRRAFGYVALGLDEVELRVGREPLL